MPGPCRSDDVAEFGGLRLPAKFGSNLCGVRDEDGGVSGAAGLFDGRDWVAGDAAIASTTSRMLKPLPLPRLKTRVFMGIVVLSCFFRCDLLQPAVSQLLFPV